MGIPIQHPRLGQDVHYVIAPGEHRAATITRVDTSMTDPAVPGLCQLAVFPMCTEDFGSMTLHWRIANYDPSGKPGTWHWPEYLVVPSREART